MTTELQIITEANQTFPGTAATEEKIAEVALVIANEKTLGRKITDRLMDDHGLSAGLAHHLVKEAKVWRKDNQTVTRARTQAERIDEHCRANRIRMR